MRKVQIILLFVLFAFLSNAGTIEQTYYFNNYKVLSGEEYQAIWLENTLLTGHTGEPVLPYSEVSLMLSPGESAVSIEFIGEEETVIPGFFTLYPRQQSRTLNDDTPAGFQKNEQVYNTDAFYPSKSTGELLTQFMNGYSFALSTFTPMKYNPVTGQVTFYKKVTIKITTKPSPAASKALQNLSSTGTVKEKIGRFAQNMKMMAQYPADNKSADDYQLMIITTAQYENDFDDLIEIYIDRGIKSEVVTKEYITANITGQDVQEKIRNYIIQEYQNHNVEYVILGGDVELIPYRGFYCYVQSGSGYEDNGIPADLYYSGLDGTWNDDNDNHWGEPGEDDLLPDIAVGRMPFSNTTELNNLKHKSISYQNNPVLGEFTTPLLAGEYLYSSPETWGKDYLELLIGYHDDNGYTTIGIPEDDNIVTMYEHDQSWSGSDLIASINSGKQFVHHVGHANETYVAHLSNGDITNSNFSGANGVDHNYTFLQTHGCMCGSFDFNDCILEKMVTIQNFAVAVIGNSRYGWFNEGQTEGPAAHLHREMVDALYHEKLNHLGAAFAESKIQTAPWVTAPGQWEEGALRWNFYDINILGDPVVSVLTDEPVSIQTTYQNTIPIGVPSTNVTVTSGGTPVENFTCAIIKDGEIAGVGYTDASGNAVINFDPVFTEVGDAQLVVSGYNCLPAFYNVQIIPNEGAYISFSEFQIDDSQGNNNGEVDFGETIGLTIEVENVGTVQADNVQVTLTTTDSYITITDGSENYGNIAGGQTASVTNGFSFVVASDIPDQHPVTFDLEMVGDDTWTSSFSLTVNAPELTIGNISIDDSQGGNGNGILDPGEMADITIQTTNAGHCACTNTLGLLTTNSSDISITNGNFNLGTINANETKNAEFTITVNANTPLGTAVDLGYEVTSGQYSAQNTFYLSIGLIVEDFETGDFSAYGWQFGGNSNWTISTEDPYEGTYSAKSGTISDSQMSLMYVEMDIIADDNISFYRKVSSESNYDFLKFYIDGVQQGEWSGEEAWAEESYAVSAGTHTFKWEYTKDMSVSNGSDCAWVDYIVFPASNNSGNPLAVTASANPETICNGNSSQLNAYTTGGSGSYDFSWTPTTGLSNPNIQNPVATPGESITYTVTVDDGNSTVSSQVSITVNPAPETPIITNEGDYLHSTASSGNQWYNSDGIIEGATSQDYYPLETGNYYVVVTNEFGCESSASNVINFIYTGLDKNIADSFNVFPNPSNGVFTIDFKNSNGQNEILIFNMLNEIVYRGKSEDKALSVDIRGAGSGVYFVKIKNSVSEVISKIIVK